MDVARAKPRSYAEMQAKHIEPENDVLSLASRPPGFVPPPPGQRVHLFKGYSACISYEVQPPASASTCPSRSTHRAACPPHRPAR